MKKITLCAILMLSMLGAAAQRHYIPVLKRQLDSILREDQKYRELFVQMMDNTKTDSLAKVLHIDPEHMADSVNRLMVQTDTSNTRWIQKVIARYGYSGKSLVGDSSSSIAWSVLQHSNQIAAYLSVVKKAASKGELDKTYAALMEDRVLMYAKKPQIYGTQGGYKKFKSGKSENIIYPIQDPAGVNERRRKAGFKTTVEENAKRLGINYRVVTMDELQ